MTDVTYTTLERPRPNQCPKSVAWRLAVG